MLKILIADDHPIVRQGLRQIVSETADMEVSGEASTGDEVTDKTLTDCCDVLLLDIMMPGKNWLDIIKQLKRESPGLPVLVLSIHDEVQYAVWAVRAGASGYLTKSSAPNELVRAIRTVVMGRRYISSSVAERLALNTINGVDKPIHETLSNREYTVMSMIVSGRKTKDIAKELSLSPKTVSTYRSRILVKLQLENQAELIRYAIKNHVLQ